MAAPAHADVRNGCPLSSLSWIDAGGREERVREYWRMLIDPRGLRLLMEALLNGLPRPGLAPR